MELKDKNGNDVKQNDWVVIFDSKTNGQCIYGLIITIDNSYFMLSPNGKIYALQRDFYKINLDKEEDDFFDLIYNNINYIDNHIKKDGIKQMSNNILNYHIKDGEPCGPDATISEIADYYGELLIALDEPKILYQLQSMLDYLDERVKKLDCILKRTCRKNENSDIVYPTWVKDQEIEKELARILDIIKPNSGKKINFSI